MSLHNPENSADGATSLVWYGAADGTMTRTNPQWQAFTGQAWEAFRDAGWLDAVHPDDRDAVRQDWRAALHAPVPFGSAYRLRHHDGSYRHIRSQSAPVFDGDRLAAWVGFIVDATESLASARALKASEERLRVLDDIGRATRKLRAPEDIMAVTTRLLGLYLDVSRCAYADVEADSDHFTIRSDWAQDGVPSSVGAYSLNLFGPQAAADMRSGAGVVVNDVDREVVDETGRHTFHALGVKAIICAGLVKDGRLVAMMAVHQAHPRHWTDDELHTVTEVVDRCWAHIERTRDAALLREQDARKDEFIATLAHELRNPLAPIKYAVTLAAREQLPATAQRRLDVIDRQVSLMARLIDDLLDISRINRGLIDLKRERVDLATLVAAAVETTQALIESRQHRVVVKVPSVTLKVDPARIVQVVGNLLTNAAKYTPQGGLIEVAARVDGDQVVLTVSDNGLGLPAADIGRLFQMFSQLRHTGPHAQGGLGLGLALVRKLVELHGGTVHAASAGLNMGSCFTVALPLRQSGSELLQPSLQTVSPAEPPPPEARPTGRILVVEDNDDGRETLVELIGSLGHAVRSAGTGPDALALAMEWVPDLVLLDLGLPGMNGLQVARALREHHPPERMVLIALTGWGAGSDMERTRAAGFDRHLTKPVEVDLLLQVVHEMLGERLGLGG